MSQYPSPYQPPQQYPIGYGGYPNPYGDPLAPARRAGIAMIVLGILALLMGGCFSVMGASLPSLMSQMSPEQSEPIRRVETQFGMSPAKLMLAAGVVTLVIGALYIVLGALVRGGRMGAVICAIILTALVVHYMLLNMVVAALTQGGAIGACGAGFVLLLFAVPLIWLIPALRSRNNLAMLQAQQQAQMWQYQQAQQAYGQGGAYGYGYPAQPPPPPRAPDDPNGASPTS